MIKSFTSLASLLFVMVLTMGYHMLSFPYSEHTQSLKTLTELTHYCEPSLSIAYDDATFNATYPEMSGLGRMDFVYEH